MNHHPKNDIIATEKEWESEGHRGRKRERGRQRETKNRNVRGGQKERGSKNQFKLIEFRETVRKRERKKCE